MARFGTTRGLARAALGGGAALAGCALGAHAGDFATRVVEYAPAAGQFVNNASFNDPGKALGAPIGGGTSAADNTKVVSLGGFGGSITLGFDGPVMDDPLNPLGLDVIVFGNAIWAGGDPTRRFAEAGVIEISRDQNGNGEADDAWYVIAFPGLSDPPASDFESQQWDDDGDTATPPGNTAWYPASVGASSFTTEGFRVPSALEASPVVNSSGTVELHYGLADMSPTMRLGDLSGAIGAAGENRIDDPEDNPEIEPGAFYTVPDDPMTVGVDAGSGGGDAFDIAWAVNPATGAPANLDGFDFIRIRTGGNALLGAGGVLGEMSTEIGAVADVRALEPTADLDGDGMIGSSDLALLLGSWGQSGPADLDGSGAVGSSDLALLLGSWGVVE